MASTGTATGAAAGTAIAPGAGTVIGGLVGAGMDLTAGLVGSAQSSHDASRARHLARQQFNAQMDESIQRRVADALKAGINPLAALGYSGGASPTFHTDGMSNSGSSLAAGISGAGSHINKMIQKLTEEKAVGDLEYDKESKQLDLESKRLENRILQQRLDANTVKPGVDMVEPKTFSGDTSDLLFLPIYDLNGDPKLLVNQNVMEMDSDNAAYRSTILSTFKDQVKKGNVDLKTGRINSQALLDLIDSQYYERTGKHIANLGNAYLSPSEASFILFDFVRDLIGGLRGFTGMGD